MPDVGGVNKRGMPSERCPAHGEDYLCVLVQGEDNDVAAYLGVGSEEWVTRFGDKVSLTEAAVHFPGLAERLAAWGQHYRG